MGGVRHFTAFSLTSACFVRRHVSLFDGSGRIEIIWQPVWEDKAGPESEYYVYPEGVRRNITNLTYLTTHEHLVFLLGDFVCFCFSWGCEFLWLLLSALKYLACVHLQASLSERTCKRWHLYSVNQLFVFGSSHKTREKEHRYAGGAPH